MPGEEQLLSLNIHFCATYDGAFYKGKKVLVIGGGNSGFEEGLFLTRFASQVDILIANCIIFYNATILSNVMRYQVKNGDRA